MRIRLFGGSSLPSVSLLVVWLSILGQRNIPNLAAVPMRTYNDPAGDLSFDYPTVWKMDNSAHFYIAPHILQGELKPTAQVIFLPAGNVYAKTTLTDLVFVYAKAALPTAEACTALAVGSTPAKPEPVVIHGVSFQHFETGDAAMCHDADQQVYWTYRGGTCYLFEGDMHTSCPGVAEGHRDLTAAETQALMRHLHAIPQSIRFAATK